MTPNGYGGNSLCGKKGDENHELRGFMKLREIKLGGYFPCLN